MIGFQTCLLPDYNSSDKGHDDLQDKCNIDSSHAEVIENLTDQKLPGLKRNQKPTARGRFSTVPEQKFDTFSKEDYDRYNKIRKIEKKYPLKKRRFIYLKLEVGFGVWKQGKKKQFSSSGKSSTKARTK